MDSTRDNPGVLLIEPSRSRELTYPLGLAYLAGNLRRAGATVHGIDLRIESDAALNRLLKTQPFAIAGIRVMSTEVRRAASIAALVRRLQPRALIVAGGPHATLAPNDVLARVGVDAAVRGDGELPLAKLWSGEPTPPGVVRGDGGSAEVYVHDELGALDFPDRTTFPMHRYYRQGSFGGIARTAMIATRGCVKRCSYCSAHALCRGSFRKREPDAVVEEIRRLRAEHGMRGVVFEDDALVIDPGWAKELFERIAVRAPGTTIDLPNGANPDLLDEDLLNAMAGAGVRSIAFGLESLCGDNQRSIDRTFDVGHLERVARHARRRGISTTGYFLIGLPHDTPLGLLSQAAAIRRLPLDLAHVSVYRRLPGQPLQQAHRPMAWTALRAVRAGFYLQYYGEPARLGAVVDRAGGGLSGVTTIARRAARWLRW